MRDYIENGRPETDEPYIFLTYRKTQLSRSAVSLIADKYFKQAGIDPGDRHHGSHSLRMTFASELVAENVPFEAVSRLLGHEDKASVSHCSTGNGKPAFLRTPGAGSDWKICRLP